MRPPRNRPGRRPDPLPAALSGAEFRYADARAAGVSKDQLCGRTYRRLHRGVYVERDRPADDERAIRAWMLALPADAALYGATAAAWYGLPVQASQTVQVIVPPGTVPRRRAGLDPHEGLRAGEATVHRGVRITTPERTWLDLSLTLGDTELVVVGDAMVRRGLTTPARLVEAAAARRRRGIVRARSLARLVRDRVDSPQETRLRLILTNDAGLPEPAVNPDVADEHGGWIGRPDLAYEDAKVAIQYEGDVHRITRKRWRSDIARDEVLGDHGWVVVRVTADDLHSPSRLCDRVRRAIHRQHRRA